MNAGSFLLCSTGKTSFLSASPGPGLQYAKDERFLKNLLENTKRYQAHFASQADTFLDVTAPRSIRPTVDIEQDTFDVLMNQVRETVASCRAGNMQVFILTAVYPMQRQQGANTGEDGVTVRAPALPSLHQSRLPVTSFCHGSGSVHDMPG